MREKLEQLIEQIGGRRRAALLGGGGGGGVVILRGSWWATAPEWVPLYSDVPVESVGRMTEKLDEAKIAYRLKNENQVLVASTDLARARVTLAQDGGLPEQGRPGMELFDQPAWGMTDFTQRINYRRALEGELERTIGKMRGVEQAQVHLAMSESALFRRQDRPMEASVVLQLAVQREVEGYLEKKAQDIVAQVVGARNARVQVAAEINFDKVERTVEAVDPDKQAVATEQRAEITPGAQGGAASTNVATSYETTKSTETVSSAPGKVRKLSVAVLVNHKLSSGPK